MKFKDTNIKLASAGSLDNLSKLIAEYWGTEQEQINFIEMNSNEWQIKLEGNIKLKHQVIFKKDRYIFQTTCKYI